MSDHRRKNENFFAYYLLTVCLIIFFAVIEIMARTGTKPEVITVLGSALTADIGMIALAAAHLWNAQKKDEVAQRAIPPNTTIDQTTTTTTKTPPAEPITPVA